MSSMTRRWVAGLAVVMLGVTAVACGSSPSTSSSPSAGNPAPYAAKGPYPVGFTTLHLADGRRVVVWYPAKSGATTGHPRENVDITSLLSPALQAEVPAADRVLYPADAFQDAPAATTTKGSFPLVLFSHGYAGFPEQSVTLTTHLASWGFVVAAPDHVERSLDGLLGTAAKGIPALRDPVVLEDTLGLLETSSAEAGLLHGLVDPQRVAVIGHSFGAAAAYETASIDPRIKSWISYAVSLGTGAGNSGPPPAVPAKPGMVMTGTADGIIPASDSEAVYAGMDPPKYLVTIAGAGHLVFSDICLIGGSKGGITQIATSLKLPIPASLLKLGSDGCQPPHPPVAKAFPAIDQLSVAFLRWSLGIDPHPVGMTTQAVSGLGASVTVRHQG
jgi:predicted dienelactone hydrolase